MKKVVIWVSEDDEEFDSEEECLEHEAELTDVSGLRAFGMEFEELKIKEKGYEDFFADAMYLYIVNKEKAQKAFWYAENLFGTSVPEEGSYNSGDVLAWNDKGSIWEIGWVNVSEIVAEFDPIYKKIMDRVFVKEDKNDH